MVTIIFQAIGIIKTKSLIRNDSSIKIIRTKILNGIVGIISVVRTLIWRSLDVKHRHESLRP